MSASREKKQRQDSGPSERNVQAKQQADAYKRRVMRYTIIGVVVVALVAALLFWDSGIIQRGQTALTVGDTKYTVNDVGFYYYTARYNSQLTYYYLGGTPPADSDVMNQETGQTYRDYYLQQARDSLLTITALYNEALKNGYSDSDVASQVQDQIDSAKSAASSNGYSYSAYLKAQFGKYMTAAAYKTAVTRDLLASVYADDYAGALEYTDEQVQGYYDEHKDDLDTYEYSYLYFTPVAVPTTDDDGNDLGLTDEEKEKLTADALDEAKTLAEGAVSALESGSSVSGLITRYSPTGSGDHNVDIGSSTSSAIPSPIKETLFGMKAGDVELVENGTSGYYAVILHARTLPQDPTADVRHILIRAESTTDADSKIAVSTDEAWAAAQAEAERILAEYRGGEQTAEAFGALAEEYSSDTGSNTNGGSYTGVYQGQFVSEFDSWLFDSARAPGDVDIIRHDATEKSNYNGYHIVYYVGQAAPVWVNTSKAALRSAEMTEWQEELESGYTAEFTSSASYLK